MVHKLDMVDLTTSPHDILYAYFFLLLAPVGAKTILGPIPMEYQPCRAPLTLLSIENVKIRGDVVKLTRSQKYSLRRLNY